MLEKAQALFPELSRLRRNIHKHPELGFQEFRTSALVADTLQEIGLEPKTGIGRTGVVAELGSGDGPTIAIRADMDALPINEKTGVAFCSVNEGVMHACGHDAHTAILLGVAHLLKQSYMQEKEKWKGNVRFLFQPSEEKFGEDGISGATAMIDDGAMEGVDAVLALHVDSNAPAGEFHFHNGDSLANVDEFRGSIFAIGGHGAAPHQGNDPFHMLSHVLNYLYSIPSRKINPLRPSIISLGKIHGGAAPNVLPKQVTLVGTIRSYDQETRDKLWKEIEHAFKLTEHFGGSYELHFTKGYPALHNAPNVNQWMRNIAEEIAGTEKVTEQEFGMGAEDFAYMAQAAPGAMFMLGAKKDEMLRPHHTDVFDIDESVMPYGAAVLAETARRYVTGQLK